MELLPCLILLIWYNSGKYDDSYEQLHAEIVLMCPVQILLKMNKKYNIHTPYLWCYELEFRSRVQLASGCLLIYVELAMLVSQTI